MRPGILTSRAGISCARAGVRRDAKDQASLQTVQVELNQPRAIDPLPIDLTTGEPAERKGKPQQRFQGQLIYFTSADVTIRRPSGAILVIDNYEIEAISDGKRRFEPV